MKKKIIFNLLFLLMIPPALFGNVSLIMKSHHAAQGTQITVPIKVKDFINIISLQGTIQFDPSILTFVNVQDFGLPSLDASDFGLSQTASGKLMLTWTDPDLSGETLTDSAVIFSIKFTVTGINGQSSALSFVNSPTPFEVYNNSNNQETPVLVNGNVFIQNINSPSDVSLIIDSVSGVHGSQVTVSCRVHNFTNINSVQGTIQFDNSVVSFNGIGYYGLPDMGYANFGLSQLSQGKITFMWNDPNFMGQNIDDGDALFSLNFILTGNAGLHSSINLINLPTAVEITDSALNLLTANITNGNINITGINQALAIKIDSVHATTGSIVSVPVRVWNFNKIISVQGTITFDPSFASFNSVEQFSLTGMDNSSFGTSLISSGKLMFSWTDATFSGQSLGDSSVLFTIKFLVMASPGSSPFLDFTNAPTPIEITDTSWGEVGYVTRYGKIVVIGGGHSLYGKTIYAGKANAGNPAPNIPNYNFALYNIGQVKVTLKSNSGAVVLANTTSDANGFFQFNNVTDGNYILSYDKYTEDTMQYCNHVNAVDIALLKYLIGHDTIVDPSRSFTSKHKKAANVDNNASINTVDIARISAKVGLPYTPARNFPKGNWVALDTSVTVAGADLNVTLQTICYGDYDASSYRYKDSTSNWGTAKVLPDENIIIWSDESIMMNDPNYFEVPLRISTKMNELSAVGLELSYPSDKFKLVSASMSNTGKYGDTIKINPTLEEIIAANNDLLVTDNQGIIRVVYATTDFFDIAANDELVRLGFVSLNAPSRGELDFDLNGTGLIANQYGEINSDAYLTMPKIFVQGNDTEAGFEFAGYPNPFSTDATLTYNLPENGTVKLNVYNAIGELVSELVNETQISGKHEVVFSQKDLSAGMYTFKLEFSGLTESRTLLLKMIH